MHTCILAWIYSWWKISVWWCFIFDCNLSWKVKFIQWLISATGVTSTNHLIRGRKHFTFAVGVTPVMKTRPKVKRGGRSHDVFVIGTHVIVVYPIRVAQDRCKPTHVFALFKDGMWVRVGQLFLAEHSIQPRVNNQVNDGTVKCCNLVRKGEGRRAAGGCIAWIGLRDRLLRRCCYWYFQCRPNSTQIWQ